MDNCDVCKEHSGVEARLTNLEEVEGTLMKRINVAHTRIDGIKNWVIAGMTSFVIQLVLVIFGLIFIYMKR